MGLSTKGVFSGQFSVVSGQWSVVSGQSSVVSQATESPRPPRGQTSQPRVATLRSRTLGQRAATRRTLKGFHTCGRQTRSDVQPLQGRATRRPETQGARPERRDPGLWCLSPLGNSSGVGLGCRERDADTVRKFAQRTHKSRIRSTVGTEKSLRTRFRPGISCLEITRELKLAGIPELAPSNPISISSA